MMGIMPTMLTEDQQAQVTAAEARAATAPIPDHQLGEWFPAMVRLPDYPKPLRLAKVYATRLGVYVYNRVPAQADRATGASPFWWAPLRLDKTPRPPSGYAARDAGIHLVTEAGTVLVQPLGGCGCQNGSLRAWRPAWASRVEPWEATP